MLWGLRNGETPMLVASGFEFLDFWLVRSISFFYAEGWLIQSYSLGRELDADEVHVLNFGL